MNPCDFDQPVSQGEWHARPAHWGQSDIITFDDLRGSTSRTNGRLYREIVPYIAIADADLIVAAVNWYRATLAANAQGVDVTPADRDFAERNVEANQNELAVAAAHHRLIHSTADDKAELIKNAQAALFHLECFADAEDVKRIRVIQDAFSALVTTRSQNETL